MICVRPGVEQRGGIRRDKTGFSSRLCALWSRGLQLSETREERPDQKLAKVKRLNVSVVRAKSRKKSK